MVVTNASGDVQGHAGEALPTSAPAGSPTPDGSGKGAADALVNMVGPGDPELGPRLTEQQARAMLRFLDMLYAANETLNLTRVPQSEALARHLKESLSVLHVVSVPEGGSVLDLGSGGGLPGVPLAIALPDRTFTLMDARSKKVAFLNSVIWALPLPNACAVHARAEEAGHEPRLRRSFDLVVVRAVAPLVKLVPWVEPLMSHGGVCAAMKSRTAQAEIEEAGQALAKSGLVVREVRTVEAPEQDAVRTIVVLGRNRPGPAIRHSHERRVR